MLLVTVEPVDATTAVLRISGDIDQDTAPDLDRAVGQCLGSGYLRLAVECTALLSCDSTGITALLRAHRSAAACGGTLDLTGNSPVLRSRLQLTGLDQILTLRDETPAVSAEILEVPLSADPSSIEAQTESLVRLTNRDTVAPAIADALSTAAQGVLGPMVRPVRSREGLAALERMHAARREVRRQALDSARPPASP